MKALTIGKAAREADVGIDTVRFYEREGLIEPASRTEAGYRLYTEAAVSRLRFIKRAKTLGFSLREIRELLSLSVDPSATKADIKKRAEAKIADIALRIQDLKRMKLVLEHLSASCDGHGPVEECPILHALEDDTAAVDPFGHITERAAKDRRQGL